ncbi:unnamed protein product [Protopolystoma xenopodis]|uniref:Uncharacterized protein n=1 Tax=Protopolystoma xenopodis TaxID=117903 RepID=A0A448X6L5_9PLAT|nr:unnamed protein product [Protopolystoma xenopodis]
MSQSPLDPVAGYCQDGRVGVSLRQLSHPGEDSVLLKCATFAHTPLSSGSICAVFAATGSIITAAFNETRIQLGGAKVTKDIICPSGGFKPCSTAAIPHRTSLSRFHFSASFSSSQGGCAPTEDGAARSLVYTTEFRFRFYI